MPHSTFKHSPTWMDARVMTFSCCQTIKFESARDWDMKVQMHEKFCDKWPGPDFTRKPKKAVMPKEAQHMTTERREFH